jgi:GTP-binding protein
MPVHILLTKADKLGRGAIGTTMAQVTRTLKNELGLPVNVAGPGGVSLQAFSAAKQTGIDDVHAVLDRWLGFEETKKTPVRPREEG